MNSQTDVDAFVSELEAGIFKDTLALMLSETALGAVVNNRKGKVNIGFSIEPIGDCGQVMVNTNLQYTKPTKKGEIIEKKTSKTAFWVARGGVLSIQQPKEDAHGQMSLVESK
jgi:hypothetical protein